MAFQVIFYNMAKKRASTLRPNSSTESTTFDCVLKSSCSIIEPQIELQGVSGDLLQYNYCYIADFRRYYYITEWRTERNIWIASLKCDVLATWRQQIGESFQYVTRSHYMHDGTLFDDLYPVKAVAEPIRTALSSPWNIAGGSYILGVINADANPIRQGAVSYYVLDDRSMVGFVKSMLQDPEKWGDVGNLFEDSKLKAQFNPLQYITSCFYLPIDDLLTGTDFNADFCTTIQYGWWSLLISPDANITNRAGYLRKRYITKTYNVTLPDHPQRNRGSYLNKNPYSEHTLTIPPFGDITIPTTDLGASQEISYRIAVDAVTGYGRLDVFSDSSTILASRSAKIGIDISLAQMSRDYMSLGQNLINTGIDSSVALASRNFIGGAAGFAKSMIGTALAFKVPKFGSTGNNGSFIDYAIVPQLSSVFSLLVDEDLTNKGRPCCKKMKQNTFPNFRICEDVQLAIVADEESYQATLNELNEIKTLMEGGYFYE